MLESAASGRLGRTALYDRHLALGARMVPFAGYEMPVQFREGIIAEHAHTRNAAGVFDVSHMGQAVVSARDHQTAAEALERLVPGDLLGLAPGRIRYTQFTTLQAASLTILWFRGPRAPRKKVASSSW
jgi:aminomethyltransferase